MTQQVKIIEFEPYHLLSLELQEEQKHFFDLFKTAKDIADYGQILKQSAVDTDDNTKCAWTGVVGDKVIGCGGIIQVQENIGEAWTLLSDDFKNYFRKSIPIIKKQAAIAKVVRVYALIDEGFEKAERFIKWTGFQYEGTLRKAGTHGQDQKMYARIREV